MHVGFIVNSKCAASRPYQYKEFAREKVHFDKYQDFSSSALLTDQDMRADQLAQLYHNDYDSLIGIGGDGTLSEIVNGLMHSGVRGYKVGLVPLGTGNDLPEIMGFQNIREIFEALLAESYEPVDVGHVKFNDNDAYFVNLASFGIGAEVQGYVDRIKDRERALDKLVRNTGLSYAVGAVQSIINGQPRQMTITVDQKTYEGKRFEVQICNGPQVAGGMPTAPEAELCDGYFDMMAIGDVGKIKAANLLLKVLLGGYHTMHKDVLMKQGKKFRIESAEKIAVNLDGEISPDWKTPFEVELLPAAVQMLSPRQSELSESLLRSRYLTNLVLQEYGRP